MKRPTPDPSWPESIREIYRNDLREIWEPTLEPPCYRLYKNQLRLYLSLAERLGARSVLDVGCAQGTLGLLLAEAGRRVTAVDIREEFLAYARSRYETGDIEFRRTNIMERPDLGIFDLVFANQIIEHLVYPVEFIRALAGYLHPNGVLVLTTPNQQYVRCGLPSYRQLGDPARHAHRQFSAGGGDHFFAYTAAELSGFVAEAGLATRSAFFFESPWISGHMKLRLLQGAFPPVFLSIADQITLAAAGRWLGHQLCVIAGLSAEPLP